MLSCLDEGEVFGRREQGHRWVITISYLHADKLDMLAFFVNSNFNSTFRFRVYYIENRKKTKQN